MQEGNLQTDNCYRIHRKRRLPFRIVTYIIVICSAFGGRYERGDKYFESQRTDCGRSVAGGCNSGICAADQGI